MIAATLLATTANLTNAPESLHLELKLYVDFCFAGARADFMTTAAHSSEVGVDADLPAPTVAKTMAVIEAVGSKVEKSIRYRCVEPIAVAWEYSATRSRIVA